jgi:hypothetical protein
LLAEIVERNGRLLLNADERNRLARNSRQIALEKFSLKKVVRKVSEACEKATKTG